MVAPGTTISQNKINCQSRTALLANEMNVDTRLKQPIQMTAGGSGTNTATFLFFHQEF